MKTKDDDHWLELKKSINKLNANVASSNSLKNAFLRGIISGVGTAVGATLIAAVGIAIIAQLMQVTGIERILPANVVEALQKD